MQRQKRLRQREVHRELELARTYVVVSEEEAGSETGGEGKGSNSGGLGYNTKGLDLRKNVSLGDG